MADTVRDQLEALVQRMNDRDLPDLYADELAFGVASDDPSNPSMTATVYKGRLLEIAIGDGYLDGSFAPTEVSVLLSGLIGVAFAAWSAQFENLRDHARSVMDDLGPGAGRAQLAREVNDPDDAPAPTGS